MLLKSKTSFEYLNYSSNIPHLYLTDIFVIPLLVALPTPSPLPTPKARSTAHGTQGTSGTSVAHSLNASLGREFTSHNLSTYNIHVTIFCLMFVVYCIGNRLSLILELFKIMCVSYIPRTWIR